MARAANGPRGQGNKIPENRRALNYAKIQQEYSAARGSRRRDIDCVSRAGPPVIWRSHQEKNASRLHISCSPRHVFSQQNTAMTRLLRIGLPSGAHFVACDHAHSQPRGINIRHPAYCPRNSKSKVPRLDHLASLTR